MTIGDPGSRLGRLAAATLVAVAASVLGIALAAPPAAAHAGFVSSDPADGETVPTAPDAITLRFTEPPDPAISQITVVDANGGEIPVGPLARDGRTGIRASLPDDLPDGVYTVRWLVVSTVDGHWTTNAFAFGVGDAGDVPRGTTAPTTAGPSVLGVAGPAALYVGLSLVIAAAVVGGWAFGTRPRALRILVPVGGAVAVAGTLLVIASEVDLIDAPVRTFLASETGSAYVQLLVAASVTAGLTVLAAARTTVMRLTAAGAGAVAVAWSRAAAGHADGVVQELVQTTHIAAVAVWIGGLVVCALLLRERRRGDPPLADVRRYSSAALVAVVIVLATGSLRAIQELGGLDAIGDALATGYGQILALKVALALALVGLGALNRRRSIPRLAAGAAAPLTRIVRAELVVGLGVALLTGTLTSLPPGGIEAQAPSRPPSIAAEGSDFGTTVRVALTVTPGTAGMNTFEAEVSDYDTGTPAAVDAVTLRLTRVGAADTSASSVGLRRDEDRWSADASAMSIAGTWNVTVRIEASGGEVEVPLVLTTRTQGATSSVAEVPELPPITTIAYLDGRSAQLYVDPGTSGPNQVHLTTFDAAGQELQLREAELVVVPPEGPAASADVLRFGPGHFVANLTLEGGTWIFDFTAVPVDGSPVQATLRATIGGVP